VGREYICHTVHRWVGNRGIHIEFIQPGNPKQNACVKRLIRTVRYEWLTQYFWVSLAEIQDRAAAWMWNDNNDRLRMALCGMKPK
jgi:putative transposase